MPPRIPTFTLQPSITSTLPCPKCCTQSPPTSRLFSTSLSHANKERRKMWQWLASPAGKNLKTPIPGSTNYLGAYELDGKLRRLVDSKAREPHKAAAEGNLPPPNNNDLRPFKLNKNFQSQAVLSEEFREVIWERVMEQKMSVAQVSRDLGVEMNRVGAVVRLKELEKRWEKEGKQLAKPYAKAILDMLPQTAYTDPSSDPDSNKRPRYHEGPRYHETINDLPVHKSTGPQLFYPTSESRSFTRVDAANVFDRTLLPADARIPHPEMIEMARDEIAGLEEEKRIEKIKEREDKAKEERAERKERRDQAIERRLTRVESQRWEFRFREVSVDDVGSDGRGFVGTGFRYGAPHLDRKRGMIKIPRKVLS